MKFTKQIIKEELDRYKNQKETLIIDETYNNNEAVRKQILSFYDDKIEELKKRLSSDKMQTQK